MATSPPPPPRVSAAPPGGDSLRRSRGDRMVAGVCAGIAARWGWDPALVRVGVVLVTVLTGGAGLIAYVVAWLVVPEETLDPDGPAESLVTTQRSHAGQLWLGVALLWVGIVLLFDRLDVDWGPGRFFWPLLLVAGGVALLVVRHPAPDPGDATALPSTSPRVPPSPEEFGDQHPRDSDVASPAVGDVDDASVTARDAATARGVIDADREAAEEQAEDEGPSPETAPSTSAYPHGTTWPTVAREFWAGGKVPESPPSEHRERSILGRLIWSALLLLVGGAWLLDLSGALDVAPEVVLAVALGIVGVALVVGAWFGSARGFIALGVVLLIPSALLTSVDLSLDGGIGERTVRPTSLADLEPTYELGIGQLVVDLSAIDPDGQRVAITLRQGIGELRVEVPRDVAVEVIGRAGIGEVDILDARPDGGFDVEQNVERGDPTNGVLVIDARVGMGEVRVDAVDPTHSADSTDEGDPTDVTDVTRVSTINPAPQRRAPWKAAA